ncbi:hypothetical protein NP493_648g00001 [Ridgeia piscesae]|uniref:Exonuclease domain-containing protein n=1 Tax=Ridgeia piscesae TaxID=27915 RepID=A0AAD9NQA0_RIDPI|nr:hypothetical protein NP493_648g00001 [Ridgeia piscesae]
MLNSQQLIQEAYPMPINADHFQDFVFTCEDYTPVTDASPMFAIDCEMCQTAVNQSELTRVSVVNERLETLYDTLVKPRNRIVNYLTSLGFSDDLMFHPYVIDTSVIYNLNGDRIMKPGLKRLSQMFLGKMIQTGHEGHDSIEDATSCMELVKLKLQHGIGMCF